MKRSNRLLVIILMMFCCFRVAAYEVQLVSNEMSIEDDIRKKQNNRWNGWWDSRYDNMRGVRLGRSGSDGFSNDGNFRISLSNRPPSMAHTTFSDGNTLYPDEPQEFGECPDFDANPPVGDAIMPLMVLMGIFVAVKKIRRQ